MFKKYILEWQQSKKEKFRQMAEKKLKLIAQRIENSKVKCKCDFYGRGLALLLQSLEPIANAENAAVDPGVYRQ